MPLNYGQANNHVGPQVDTITCLEPRRRIPWNERQGNPCFRCKANTKMKIPVFAASGKLYHRYACPDHMADARRIEGLLPTDIRRKEGIDRPNRKENQE